MDPNYFWAALAATVGAAAGFQGIFERHGKDAFPGSASLPGFLYLTSRAALPAMTFCLFYSGGAFKTYLWAWALSCGTGSEALLRTKFFIKKAELPALNAGATPRPADETDVMFGPLNLWNWWQQLALSSIGTYLSEKRLRFVERNTPEVGDFSVFCKRVKDRIGGITDQEVAGQLRKKIDDLCEEFDEDTAPDSDHYRIEIGLLLYRYLARREFKSVVKTPKD